MARGNQTPFYLGLSALFYFALLFSPIAFVQTAHAQEDAVQENYGTGMCMAISISFCVLASIG